jgi:hypothetical protein
MYVFSYSFLSWLTLDYTKLLFCKTIQKRKYKNNIMDVSFLPLFKSVIDLFVGNGVAVEVPLFSARKNGRRDYSSSAATELECPPIKAVSFALHKRFAKCWSWFVSCFCYL